MPLYTAIRLLFETTNILEYLYVVVNHVFSANFTPNASRGNNQYLPAAQCNILDYIYVMENIEDILYSICLIFMFVSLKEILVAELVIDRLNLVSIGRHTHTQCQQARY